MARGVEVAGDPALVGQGLQGDLGAGHRVPRGHGDVDGVLGQRRQPDARIVAARAEVVLVDDGEIDLAELQRGQRVLRLELGEQDLGARMAAGEARHRQRHERRRRGGEGGQAHAAADVAVGELGLGRLELGQDALGTPDQQPRRGGEDHAASLALEERDPGLALERREVLGDGGGRVAECLSRGGDGAALRELAQHVQAADVEHCEAELTLTVMIRKWT